MSTHHLIAWAVIGIVAGALAGRVVRGRGFGILGDLVVGLIGAFIGGFVIHAVTGAAWGSTSLIGELAVSFIGACLLVALLRLGRRGGRPRMTAGYGRW